MLRTHLFAILVLLIASMAPAAASDDAKGIEFFEKKIRPLLAKHCYECHDEIEKKSGLELDSWEGMEAGGDTGESLFAFDDPERSLLIAVLRYELEDLEMPPEGQLEDEEVENVLSWIEMGAPHPDKEEAAPPPTKPMKPKGSENKPAPEKHWSFQPLKKVVPPQSAIVGWSRTPIDPFIASRLKQQAIAPVKLADRRTFIRRATLDLWGLPPAVDDVQRFVDDPSADAYDRLIDRLLASPRYGERWGRHWLDVARYADSNGLDENIAHGNAWRYRDYVVAALNRDKSFRQFVLEQLAGDRLEADSVEQRHEQLVATGFLSLGPKVLAESDLQKLEMDIIDEQIDTVGRAFLGVTLGCARCHDHKFDPITSEDYYALAGVFKSTQTMENYQRIARWYEHSLADEESLREANLQEEAICGVRDRVQVAVAAANERLTESHRKLAAKQREEKWTEPERKQIAKLRAELAAAEAKRVEFPTAMGVTEGKATDLRVHIRGSHLSLGKLAKRRIPEVFANDEDPWPAERSGRLRLARWIASDKNPLTARVLVNRVWRWHFGRGLSATTDNLGRLGEKPTHPDLLDWLAQDFMDHGWSVKHLHRRIMLSTVYRLSSDDSPQARKTDPDNRLYWRFEPRRLEAEAIRDALLYVSGRLDPRMGGSMLHVKNREFFFNHLSKDTTSYASQRRSLYLPIVRNNLYDVFTLFDYSDASMLNGDRASTTVAPQALFMMNSDLVLDCAKSLGDQIAAEAGTEEEKVERLFERLLSRRPTATERDALLGFHRATSASLKAEGTPTEEAWRLTVQIGFASNEFIYLR